MQLQIWKQFLGMQMLKTEHLYKIPFDQTVPHVHVADIDA